MLPTTAQAGTTFVPDPSLPPLSSEDAPDCDCFGTQPDEPLRFIPEVQKPDRAWLGLSMQELVRDEWADEAFQQILLSVSGPAGLFVSVSEVGSFEPTVHIRTDDGVDAMDI